MARRSRSYQGKYDVAKIILSLLIHMMKRSRVKNKRLGVLFSVFVALCGFWLAFCQQHGNDKSLSDDAITEINVNHSEFFGNDKSISDDVITEINVNCSEFSDNDKSIFDDAITSQTANDSVSSDHYRVPNIEKVTIERCVDGDTLVVINSSGVRERVRLIGANTPETVKKNWPVEPFGPEASEYTKRRVKEAGNIATLVADGTSYDRYNRRLAFVFLGDDQISLNEELCRQGLAKAETKYSFSKVMKSRLTAAAKEAEREGLGIYSIVK